MAQHGLSIPRIQNRRQRRHPECSTGATLAITSTGGRRRRPRQVQFAPVDHAAQLGRQRVVFIVHDQPRTASSHMRVAGDGFDRAPQRSRKDNGVRIGRPEILNPKHLRDHDGEDERGEHDPLLVQMRLEQTQSRHSAGRSQLQAVVFRQNLSGQLAAVGDSSLHVRLRRLGVEIDG